MKTVIHLKVARVTGQKPDGMPNISRDVIKLEDGDNFNKFIRHIPMTGYIMTEPPTVVEVLQKNAKGEYKKVSATRWQESLDQVLEEAKNVNSPKVDYKKELEAQKKQNQDLLKRIEALEASGEKEKD